MFTGAFSQKNSLGSMCLISGIYFTWYLLFGSRTENEPGQKWHFSIYLIMLPMIAWLLYMANSATSTACMFAAVLLLVVAKIPLFNREPKKIIIYTILFSIAFGLIQVLFDIKTIIIEMLGRRPDLTTRVPMWADLLGMVKNPLIGAGFESFWLGERLITIQSRWGKLIQAHNGYIEMYLNLGFVGVFFIVGWFLSGLMKTYRYINAYYSYGLLRFCIILVVALYNYTEATFYGVSVMWMLFFIVMMDIPKQISPRNL